VREALDVSRSAAIALLFVVALAALGLVLDECSSAKRVAPDDRPSGALSAIEPPTASTPTMRREDDAQEVRCVL
jgi:hypothetical protein